MTGVIVRNVWKEYDGQVILERINLDRGAPQPSSPSSARPAAASPPSCGCC